MPRRPAALDDVDAVLTLAAAQAPHLAADLRERAEWLRVVLRERRAADVAPFPLPRERLVGKLREGAPLLNGEQAQIDLEHSAGVFAKLIAGDDGPHVQGSAPAPAELALLLEEAFEQHPDHVALVLHRFGLSERPFATVAGYAVLPSRWTYAAHLSTLATRLNALAYWRQAYCYLCGNWPTLLLGNASTAWCAACDVAWPYAAPACAFCGAQQPPRQVRGAAEGSGPQPGSSGEVGRIAACPRCLTYLVVMDTDVPLAHFGLDLAIHAAAQVAGYRRPAGTGFRIELATPEPAWVDDLEGWDG